VKSGTVTLAWSAVEGGSYSVLASTNLTGWSTLATGVAPTKSSGSYADTTTLDKRFYRVGRTSVASFDSAGTTSITAAGIPVNVPGGSASRGTTVTATITLPGSPPSPPANAPITSVTLGGSITGTGISYTTSGTVVATFVIPSNATTGLQSVVVVFSGPTFTVSGLTVN
jgi:hypothetical protein